jgi:ABC-type spermidine/putrescine transport system permease subunit I
MEIGMAVPSGPFDRLAEFFAEHRRALFYLQIAPPLLFVLSFVFVPLGSIFVWSFGTVQNNRLVPGFSTSAYTDFLGIGAPGWRFEIFLKTLRIAVTQTVIAMILGFAIAYFVGIRMRGSRFTLPLLLLFAVPFLTSYLLRTLSWYMVLGIEGLINTILQASGLIHGPLTWLLFSEFAVHVGFLSTYLPFMIFPVWLAMSRIDRNVLAASADLGGRPRDTLFRVVIPLTLPGILIGCIFVFVGVLGDSVVPQLLGGPSDSSRTLVAGLIDQAVSGQQYTLAAAMASIILFMAVGLILAWEKVFGLKKIGEV